MKKSLKILCLVSVFALSAIPAITMAQPDVGLEYGTYTGLGTQDLRAGIMSVVNTLMGFLGIIAIIIFLWGGFRWMTAAGNDEKVGEAKKIITAGIIGLIIIFVSYAIASFVIGQLITATGANY